MNKLIKTNAYATLVNDIAEIYNRARKTLIGAISWVITSALVKMSGAYAESISIDPEFMSMSYQQRSYLLLQIASKALI